MIELDLVYKEHLYKQQEERKKIQDKAFAYYSGDEKEIIEYLDLVLGKTFDSADIDDFQKDYLNITRKLIHETSVVYSEPPERWIVGKNGEEIKGFEDYYDIALTGRLNSKDKKIHRFGKLFNTALMEVFFNKHSKKVDFKIEKSSYYTVVPSEEDYQRIGVLMYDKYFKNAKNEDELYTVVWTPEKHFKLDANGNEEAFEGNEQKINPYGVIPFAIYRSEEMSDFWGVGQDDIVNTNEIINIFLTDLANGTLLSAWGTPLYVNCDLQKKSDDKDTNNVKRVRIGPKHPIIVENSREGTIPPRIEYVSHNAEIETVKNLIDWRIKLLAANKGLSPDTFLQEAQATSGFSKVMDRISQIEIRNDDIEPAREFEEERFNIIKAVNNYHYDEIENGKKIPEEAKIKVDFAEINIPETKEEKWKDRAEQEKRYMATPKDWLKEDNPDLTDDEAEEILIENRRIADEITQAEPKSNFQRMIEGQGEDEDINNENQKIEE